MPHKSWAVGAEVLAAEFNPYVADQIVARYPNASARTADWPSPPIGAASTLDDTPGRLFLWTGTQWIRSDWSSAWGVVGFTAVVVSAANGSGNTPTDWPGMGVTWTAVAGRRYRTSFQGHAYSSVNSDVNWFTLCDSANAVKCAVNAVNNTTGFAEVVTFFAYEIGLAAGSVTRKIRFYPPAGGGIMNAFADASRPAFLLVEDVGPAALPTLRELAADAAADALAELPDAVPLED